MWSVKFTRFLTIHNWIIPQCSTLTQLEILTYCTEKCKSTKYHSTTSMLILHAVKKKQVLQDSLYMILIASIKGLIFYRYKIKQNLNFDSVICRHHFLQSKLLISFFVHFSSQSQVKHAHVLVTTQTV